MEAPVRVHSHTHVHANQPHSIPFGLFQSAANFSLDGRRSILLSSLIIDSAAAALPRTYAAALPPRPRLRRRAHYLRWAAAAEGGRTFGRRTWVGSPPPSLAPPRPVSLGPRSEWKEEAAAAKDSNSKKTQPRIIASPERGAKGSPFTQQRQRQDCDTANSRNTIPAVFDRGAAKNCASPIAEGSIPSIDSCNIAGALIPDKACVRARPLVTRTRSPAP